MFGFGYCLAEMGILRFQRFLEGKETPARVFFWLPEILFFADLTRSDNSFWGKASLKMCLYLPESSKGLKFEPLNHPKQT